jgi:hypothetical protein
LFIQHLHLIKNLFSAGTAPQDSKRIAEAPTDVKPPAILIMEALAKPPASVLQAQYSEARIQYSEWEPSLGPRDLIF